MRRARSVETLGFNRRRKWRFYYFVLAAGVIYLIFISLKFPRFLQIANYVAGDEDRFDGVDHPFHTSDERPFPLSDVLESTRNPNPNTLKIKPLHGRVSISSNPSSDLTELDRMTDEAWILGTRAWDEVEASQVSPYSRTDLNKSAEERVESCPSSMSMWKKDDVETLMFLPCGLSAGSAITIIGRPQEAHEEFVPQLARQGMGDGIVLVSQFMVELQGLKAVDGEDPPRIFYLNPRLRGDWSHHSVIEHNTCYRMHWDTAMRCDGLLSKDEDDTVDGFSKCEKWVRNDVADSKESKTISWLRRFIGRAKKPAMTWPFPFVEGELFILTLRAGIEGFHLNVAGRHVTSFPYRPGFTLEDATGLAIKGDVEIHSVYATSLPQSHPSFSLQRVLEMSDKWKSRPLPESPVQLFIGILSATNHFAERMAIRKTWMQSSEIKSSNVVARFFVALNPRKEVNAVLKKEAEYFGDIIILPFMDRYEIVVLKTIAICEYGIQNASAVYIMKCDDDTFVRIDVILNAIKGMASKKSLYMGNLNLLHRPLRSGKWAVTYEEWPEEIYPAYANGPGYIITSDIAGFIVSQHASGSLRLFKMEDVSMGMWVEQFNATTVVHYSHNWKFCQYGCVENYYTAHYQSPRQMICLWDKLARGRAQCCNFR